MLGFEDIPSKLRGYLAAAKESAGSMRLEDMVLTVSRHGAAADSHLENQSKNGWNHLKSGEKDEADLGTSLAGSSGRELSDRLVTCVVPMKSQPFLADEVDSELLLSGAATFLGTCSRMANDVAVVGIFTENCWWNRPWSEVKPEAFAKLTKLLSYYGSIIRNELFSRILFFITCRGSQLHIFDLVLELLSTINVDIANAVDSVLVFCDMNNLSLVRKKLLSSRLKFRTESVTDFKSLHRLLDADRLPKELEGTCPYAHLDWVSFRKVQESLRSLCNSVAEILLRVADKLVQNSSLPRSVEEAKSLLQHHDQSIETLLKDERFDQLWNIGAEWIEQADDTSANFFKHQDFSRLSGCLAKLYPFLLKMFLQISSLARERRLKLVESLKLRELEDAANQFVEKLENKEDELKNDFSEISVQDLPEVKLCQQKFSKLEASVQVTIDTGQAIVKKAKLMLDSCQCKSIVGLKGIVQILEPKISNIQDRLKVICKKIEQLHDCYVSLERSNEWFTNAAQVLSSLNDKERVMSSEETEMRIETFLSENPEVPLDKVMDQCKLMKNEVLHRKCMVAHHNATKMFNLLKIKQNRERIPSQFRFNGDSTVQLPTLSNDTSERASFVSVEDFRRRSYAGRTAIPVYGPWRHSLTGLECDADLQAYVELLFKEGLITNDMSKHIVTRIPKSLSDSTMRGSRESLRSSRESLRQSNDSLVAMAFSSESLPTLNHGELHQTDRAATLNRRGLPRLRLFQKDRGLLSDQRGSEGLKNFPGMTMRSLDGGNSVSVSCQSLNQTQSLHRPRVLGTSSSCPAGAAYDPNVSSQESQEQCVSSDRSSENQRQRNLAMVMQELIDTERNYISSLKFVVTKYIPELICDDLAPALRGKRSIIFGNLEKICDFHSRLFLAELEKCADAPLSVGNVFLRHAKELYMYAQYSKNKPRSNSVMAEGGILFFRRKQKELGDKMDLSSYLLKPIQRMGQYALFLEQILKDCDVKDPNYSNLKEALELVRFELRHGNDLLAMDSIRQCDVNLQEQGMLLRQEEFLVWHMSRKRLRRVFLFEELILFSKTRRHSNSGEHYIYKDGFKLCDIGMTENVATNERLHFEIWFRKRIPKFTFVLQAPSASVRQAWTNEIAVILWKQAVRNRKQNLSELLHVEMTLKETNEAEEGSNSWGPAGK